jgi:hypothetical protein
MSAAQVQKWGVIYNADALTIDDMLHFSSLADTAVLIASGPPKDGAMHLCRSWLWLR